MSRYIDADKLRKDEIARCHCVPCVGSNDSNYKDLDEVLNDAPTADVVEVRHGEWISESFISKTGEKLYHTPMCSVCNQRTSFRSKFCPDCGAKMDGERRKENER